MCSWVDVDPSEEPQYQYPEQPSSEQFEQLSLGFLHHTSSAAFEAVPTLELEIRQHQKDDEKLQEIRELLKKGKCNTLI